MNNHRKCKICYGTEMGPFHFLVKQIQEAYNARRKAEDMQELEIAKYHWMRYDDLYKELKHCEEFHEFGLHDFELMNNLEYLEMLNEQKQSL